MRELGSSRSGQVLILAALAVALIISSTVVYIYQTSQISYEAHPFSSGDFVRVTRLGSRNLVIGSLANVSYGGSNQTLKTNLDRWCDFAERQYFLGMCLLRFELCEVSPYALGLWIFWGAEGFGVTSAKVDFSMNLTDKGTEVTAAYGVNVTTSLSISGAYSKVSGPDYEVNVTAQLYNEGELALARNLTVFYETRDTGWNDASLLSGYSLKDFGNGTYVAFFTCSKFTDQISVHCYDQREIYVQADATCIKL